MNFWNVFLVSFASATAQLLQPEPYNYCDPELKLCETSTDHTMCKYPVPGLSDQCTAAAHEALSANDKKRILFLHNKFRSNVASGSDRSRNRKLPTASDMRQIYWDKELETIATRWAEQCVAATESDICRNIKRFRVSQNVGSRRVNGSSIDKQIPQIIISWLKEGKDFDPAWVDSSVIAEDKVSQFVNIIRGDTYAMGCASIVFQEHSGNDQNMMIERLVCNYGPGGIEEGKPVFKRGTPCQNCPDRTQCSGAFPGLCALQNVDRTDPTEDPKTEAETSTQETNLTLKDSATSVSTSTEDDSEGFFLEDDSCSGDDCSSEETPKPPLDRNRFSIIIKPPKPAGGKYLVKHGVYLNGKCHCSDTYRSKAHTLSARENEKRVRKVVRDVVGKASGQKMENGDRCQCYEFVAESENAASCVYFHFYFIVLYIFVFIEV